MRQRFSQETSSEHPNVVSHVGGRHVLAVTLVEGVAFILMSNLEVGDVFSG